MHECTNARIVRRACACAPCAFVHVCFCACVHRRCRALRARRHRRVRRRPVRAEVRHLARRRSSTRSARSFGFADDHLFVLAENESAGVGKATRENVQRRLRRLARAASRTTICCSCCSSATARRSTATKAKFNLVGPDLSASEWAELLKPIPGRLVFVDTTGGELSVSAQARRRAAASCSPRPIRRRSSSRRCSRSSSSRRSTIRRPTSTRTAACRSGRRSPTPARGVRGMVRAARAAADRAAAARRHRRRHRPRGAESRAPTARSRRSRISSRTPSGGDRRRALATRC